ncbi:hypothetical protein ASPZODRAFT_129707 [Penicilliopsis zonata CBS 506.65]|uniref:TPR domain protein n=1 Tax=Penicilliopsis zonata CBS 506.65 TaxID=1073090 RepID=A0A1L9SQB0_9EURO|nr:hypothetical protein ASPZODRAFT_129707 [Penicilliopsis zonata CBS 506.65]OJJ49277.1 hypothetical protein ASPZODRAFT_129707 [Penicilliopsis zonata CBS 506.65]
MFHGASRRVCAHTPRLLQSRLVTTRSLSLLNTTRLGGQSRLPQTFRYARMQTRQITFTQRVKLGLREASKGIWRKNPIMLPLAILSVIGATAVFSYIVYVELTQVRPRFHKFPPPVADALRTAVYYTEIDLSPAKALKAYKEALQIAFEMGMHPYSDEILGIKLQVAMMLEKAGLVQPAIDVLERTKAESLDWIEQGRMRKLIQDMEVEMKKEDATEPEDPEVLEEQKKMKELEKFEEHQRDKVLKKVVGMNIKLAELYASDYIQDEKKAEACQVAAVELCLKEMKHRQSLGIPVGGARTDNDMWMNVSEIATTFVDLATTYTKQERHELAMPLYLRALDMIHKEEGDSPSCKQVVLLNDVASAMAGQAQRLKSGKAGTSTSTSSSSTLQQPVPSREEIIGAAMQWAQKAIDVAAKIQPPTRDQDCDVSCVAATYNLGELAEMQNNRDQAEKYYKEAKALAQGLEYEEGVAIADTALKRLAKK